MPEVKLTCSWKNNEEWFHEHGPGNILLLACIPCTVSVDREMESIQIKDQKMMYTKKD